MAKIKLLIIDDDQEINKLLKVYLEKFGYTVLATTEPQKGIEIALTQLPDLIILDIMMPELNGFEVCSIIRKSLNTPIIMLTARGDVTDRVVGLEMGADDYMPKPFEPRELEARIRTILRRTSSSSTNSNMKFDNLVLFPEKYLAELDGKPLDLSSLEFDVLLLFAKNRGRVMSRDSIMDNLKGSDWAAFDRSIDMLISRLRQKLKDDPQNPQFIKTVRNVGYVFIVE